MPSARSARSAGETKPTDRLWLAAHDGDRDRVGPVPLGIGMAAGLLGEAVLAGKLTLRDGLLVRKGTEYSWDLALAALLARMARDEQVEERSAQADTAKQAPTERPASHRAPTPVVGSARVPARPPAAYAFAAMRQSDAWGPAAPPESQWADLVAPDAPEDADETTDGVTGVHDLAVWLAFLAQGDAEQWVIDRLAEDGLVYQGQRRRLLRTSTSRWLPSDSVVSGMPGTAIVTAVQRGHPLSFGDLYLAGLMRAIGLDHKAFASLSSSQRQTLRDQVRFRLSGLDADEVEDPVARRGPMLIELLDAATAAVGNHARLRR